MINFKFVLSLSMVLSSFLNVIPQVIGHLSQNHDEFGRVTTDGYNLDDGPVVYQAYYPDYQNLEQEKNFFYRPSIVHDSWKYQYNTPKKYSEINNRNLDDYSVPISLRQMENKRVFNNNPDPIGNFNRNIDNQESEYEQRSGNTLNVFVDTVNRKDKNSIDKRVMLKNLRNQGRLVAKTYLEYWKLANALLHEESYGVTPQLHTDHATGPEQSVKNILSNENIWQARPQVINYVSSLPATIPAKRIGNELIQNDVSKSDQHPRIESIEVQGNLPHKIRHHHDERKRRPF